MFAYRTSLLLVFALGVLALGACRAPSGERMQTSTDEAWKATPIAAPQPVVAEAAPEPPQPISRVMLRGGLVVEDLVIGDGPLCDGPGDVVTVQYRGTFAATGEVFDGTEPGHPAELPLSKLIAGWKEGVPGMRVGGKRRLTIPAALAYGERGLKEGDRYVIPPQADLVFEIELLGVR